MKTAQDFKDAWEKFENDKITSDRDQRILVNSTDKEWAAENAEKYVDEEQKFVEEKIIEIEADIADEDHRNLVSSKFRLEFQSLVLKEREEFKERIVDFKKYKVIKYGKFLQALLYLLGYEKDKVVEPGTQKFFWKTAK